MPVRGADIVAKNIAAFGGGFTEHCNRVMESVKIILDDKITIQMNLEDHSLSDLRRLGHPYAKRHGPGGLGLHDQRPWQVHKQGGQLLQSKKSGTEKASIAFGNLKASAYVTIDENEVSYVNYLIWGTSRMIPRDFMTGGLNIAKDPALQYLKANLRDFVFNFKPIQ